MTDDDTEMNEWTITTITVRTIRISLAIRLMFNSLDILTKYLDVIYLLGLITYFLLQVDMVT